MPSSICERLTQQRLLHENLQTTSLTIAVSPMLPCENCVPFKPNETHLFRLAGGDMVAWCRAATARSTISEKLTAVRRPGSLDSRSTSSRACSWQTTDNDSVIFFGLSSRAGLPMTAPLQPNCTTIGNPVKRLSDDVQAPVRMMRNEPLAGCGASHSVVVTPANLGCSKSIAEFAMNARPVLLAGTLFLAPISSPLWAQPADQAGQAAATKEPTAASADPALKSAEAQTSKRIWKGIEGLGKVLLFLSFWYVTSEIIELKVWQQFLERAAWWLALLTGLLVFGLFAKAGYGTVLDLHFTATHPPSKETPAVKLAPTCYCPKIVRKTKPKMPTARGCGRTLCWSSR